MIEAKASSLPSSFELTQDKPHSGDTLLALKNARDWITYQAPRDAPDRDLALADANAALAHAHSGDTTTVERLNREVDRWVKAYQIAHTQAMENGSALAECRAAIAALATDNADEPSEAMIEAGELQAEVLGWEDVPVEDIAAIYSAMQAARGQS